MHSPVQCAYCGAIYDLAGVSVVARYADCSVYRTPCCDHEADDRTGVSQPSFRRLPLEDEHRPDGTIVRGAASLLGRQ